MAILHHQQILVPTQAVPRNMCQEDVSISFVRALVAQAGLNLMSWHWDDGIDLTVGACKSGYAGVRIRNAKFHLQVKSQRDWTEYDGKISYYLEAKKFNQLAGESVDPQHLVLYTVHSDRRRWVESRGGCSILNHCAYFYSFSGERPLAEDQGGKTLRIPLANRLTAGELIRMYREAAGAWEKRK